VLKHALGSLYNSIGNNLHKVFRRRDAGQSGTRILEERRRQKRIPFQIPINSPTATIALRRDDNYSSFPAEVPS
jgi:hypothetical protein